MSILCKIGIHNWRVDCEHCAGCGETRTAAHNWAVDCEKCANCHKTRNGTHNWNGCRCETCGKIAHDWDGDCGETCRKCGKTRLGPHKYVSGKCRQCGKLLDLGFNMVAIPAGEFLSGYKREPKF